MKTRCKINQWLNKNGQNRRWLASQLDISYESLNTKMKSNIFTTGDCIKMMKLGILK
jgi:hypothetical protein